MMITTYKKYFQFDKKNQKIKAVGSLNKVKKKSGQYEISNVVGSLEIGSYTKIRKIETDPDPNDQQLPEEWKPFIKKRDNSLDTEKYFFNFIEQFYTVVSSGSVKLPEGLKLSTDFPPCEVCKIEDNIITQYVRCYHNPDCEDHKKKLDDPNHVESCDCKNFTSPCITYSKIGLVWHLEFVQPDGSLLNIDVDISPPTIPVINDSWKDFDGSNEFKRTWLTRFRPYLWLSEFNKTHNMSDAAGVDDGLRRSIRLRFYNLDQVIAEQVCIHNQKINSMNKLP